MARTKAQKIIPLNEVKAKVYAEGKHDYAYLSKLVTNGLILEYEKATLLQASEIERRIQAIKRDINNDAIEHVIWVVDGCDQHIKKSKKHFLPFYKEWSVKRNHEWRKLHILINAPCLEYWLLLHRVDPPLDAQGKPICFQNATALDNSLEFKNNCPEGKGARLVAATASNDVERKRAIKRGKKLGDLLVDLPEKKLLSVARAELYQVFDLIPVKRPNYS